MFKIQTKSKSAVVGFYYLFIAMIVLAPTIYFFLPSSLVVGTIVNSLLLLSTYYYGIKKSFVLAFFPSLIALTIGMLSISFLYFVPFIIISNCLLMMVFHHYQKNLHKALGYAAFAKIIFLFGSFSFIMKIMANEAVGLSFSYGILQITTLTLGSIVARSMIYLVSKK